MENERNQKQTFLEQLFKITDVDQNGYLDFVEFRNIMEKYDPSLNIVQIGKIFKKMDQDRNGTITMKALKIKYNLIKSKRAVLEGFFHSVDADNNGSIDFSEYKQIMVKYDPRLDDSDLIKMFDSIDEDKNGTITLEEYIKANIGDDE